jgi:hypothetical protein
MSRLFAEATASASSLDGASQRVLNMSVLDALQTLGVQEGAVTVITATRALTMADAGLVLIDASAGSVNLTMPASGVGTDNAQFKFVRVDTSSNAAALLRAGSDTIEGATSTLVVAKQRITLEMPAGQTIWRITSLLTDYLPIFIRNIHHGFRFDATGPVNLTCLSGQCADSTNALIIDLAGSLNKGVGAWAVGNASGGLDTGTIAANTWYHWYVIRRADTGVVDLMFSTSFTAPTMPSGYTHRRWIGAFRTNASSQWIPFHQTGDDVYWLDPITDVATGSTPGTSFRTFPALTVPPGFRAKAYIGVGATSSSGVGGLLISDLQSADTAPLTSAAQGLNTVTVAAGAFSTQRFEVYASTAREIGARGNSATTTYGITTFGFNIANAKGR